MTTHWSDAMVRKVAMGRLLAPFISAARRSAALPAKPSGWMIMRGELVTPCVGPFATEAEAIAWQEADSAAHGDCEWSAWPLFKPDDLP